MKAGLGNLRIVSSVLIGLSAFGCSDPPMPEEASPPVLADVVRLTEAQVESAAIVTAKGSTSGMRQSVRVPGSVNSPDTAQATVGSIVEGRVESVHVLPGDRVRRGQPLVEIHTHELADAQAALTAAAAELQFSSEAVDRARTLYEAGAISLQELQRRETDFERDRAEQTRAQEMVEHLHPSRRGNATAVAPQAGVVFSVAARSGQAVLPGTALVTLGTTDVLWVTAFVPENTSAVLERGDEVSIEFGSAPGTQATGRLVQMSEFVDPANRSVEMRFELQSIPAGVRPGSFATVNIADAAEFFGVELAEEAAVRVGEDDVVFVEEARGEYRALRVTVTALRPGWVAVQGIPDGASVVVEGAYFLKSALDAASTTEEAGAS